MMARILPTDEELVATFALGDERALGHLYDRHWRVAYSLALRVLRDPDLAEDAVQEAFLTAWRTAASFDPRRARASTWLFTFVHRRAVDIVRSRTHGAVFLAEPRSADEPCSPAADDEAALLDGRRRVRGALDSLPSRERSVVELAYYGGLRQSEVAQLLDLPLGTVKSRTFTALARLRSLLGEEALESAFSG